MSKLKLFAALALVAIGIVAAPLNASGPPSVPVVADWAVTDNLTPLGFAPRPNPAAGVFNSDLAFWGDWAFQGTYDGFRIVDITYPSRPKERLFQPCNGNQGDIVVWGDSADQPDLLVRSYNTPAPAGLTCDGQTIPTGFEGIHVFDLSNFGNPQLVAQVPVPGGSHTATLVPDTANNRVIIYNQTSGGTTPFISIISVPLNNLAGTSVIGTAPLTEADACHDSGVILGNVNKMVCASHDHANVFDIGANEIAGRKHRRARSSCTPSRSPGSATSPATRPATGTGTPPRSRSTARSSSSAGSPAAASAPEVRGDRPARQEELCSSTTPKRAPSSGSSSCRGRRRAAENCTIHNYNVVPLRNKGGKPRYVLVGGNYQAGISVVDFTNPAAAKEIAYADPPPLVPTQLGGDWSTYWYNGRIYESDITRGLAHLAPRRPGGDPVPADATL